MALRIQVQIGPWGSFSDVDLEAYGLGEGKLKVGYGYPSELSFTATAAQHTYPFQYTQFLRIWDDEAEVDSDSQTDSNPLFEGWFDVITPGDKTNEVKLICYDPTARATKHVTVMNDAWDLSGDSDKAFPVEGVASYPRAVFNVPNDNDDDYGYSILQDATLGQIIAQVLDDARLPLYHLNAGPGDGTGAGADQNWLDSDLGEPTGDDSDSGSGSGWAGGLDFKPQEKVVSQSENVRQFIERLLGQYDPRTKLFWHPGERLWRFYDITKSPAVTITVNDPTAWHGAVLSMEIHRSAEGRYGAVKFYGPEGTEWSEFTWTPGGTGDTMVSLNDFTTGSAPSEFVCYHRWKITDPTFTRIARKGPYPVYSPAGYFLQTRSDGTTLEFSCGTFVQTWWPHVLVQYEDGDGGNGNFAPVSGFIYDARSGILDFGDVCIYRWLGPGTGNRIQTPATVKFVCPTFTVPLTVRYPETEDTYEGTISTVAGIQNELKIYDESLAIDKAYGIPITSNLRRQRFLKLAKQIHRARKDLIYAGSIVLEGLNYEFARLNRRVNIAAVDDNGDPIVTGWEDVGAWVTEVEYDFEERTTTLTFSSDQLQVIGIDPELLKTRLKIHPASPQFVFKYSVAFTKGRRRTTLGVPIGEPVVTYTARTEYRDQYGELQ